MTSDVHRIERIVAHPRRRDEADRLFELLAR